MADVQTEIINPAFRALGVLAAGEVPTYDESNDALRTLNQLLDQWKAERLQIFTVTRSTWAITANIATYSVGTGSTVNTERPVNADNMTVQYIDTSVTPSSELPLTKLSEDARAAISIKTLTSNLPTTWYYNPTYPVGVITFWPVPTSSTLVGVLYAPTPVSTFAALTTTVSLPPGYASMLMSNLALRLSSEYPEAQPSPMLMMQARDSLATVRIANRRDMDMSMPPGALVQGVTGRLSYDIRTGQ